MDNTLDTIRASSDATIQEEVSYLYGRDPSILAYGQRFISKDSQKNLYSLYEEEESADGLSSDSLSHTIKVYLRMKPFPRKMILSKDQEEAYTIVNSTTLFTKMPSLEHNASCLKRPKSSDTVSKKFTFTKTFGPETTQSEIFEQAVRPQMELFLAGQNSSVMTYGTTNSGKSYTLQGTDAAPGIIPRGLEYIFSNIIPKVTPCYKPINYSDVVVLNGPERVIELEIKANLFSFGSMDKSEHVIAYQKMQNLLQEEFSIRTNEPTHSSYSVWVSFAEIYNETIYDLLSNDVQTRRPALKVSTDSQGRAFIKGLKHICVNSGSEAYQVLLAGQYNLKVAATALNARSSRSHCIFTVTLLKYDKEDSPESVGVSTFAFCDLAGSERLKKTLNEGDRLKEAQNINTSLLVLGRCLKSIYESQGSKQKQNMIGPFRESKLTRLFQKALSGHENIALIVNVNPVPNLYVETQNVLNFSAIAKKIIIEPKPMSRKKSISRFSMKVTQSIQTVTDWDTMDLDNIEEIGSDSELEGEMVHREDYDEILIENRKLKQELAALRNSTLERDLQIRQELADTYSDMIKKIEDDWRNRVKDVEEQQEDHLEYSLNRLEAFYKEKIHRMNSRKRMRSDVVVDELDDEDKKSYEELEDEIAYLTSKVKNMKETIRSLREQKEKEIVEKTKISFELSLIKDELKDVKKLLESANKDSQEEGDHNFIQELKTQLKAEREKNKQLKVFLNEAKEDYISITTDGRHMEKKLKEKEELLLEFEDRMLEMETQIESTNVCLAGKVKIIENLEDKVDNQNKLIADLEEDIINMKEKQRLQRNIMRSVKGTQTAEILNSLEIKEEPRAEVRDESSQTCVLTFTNCEVQTDMEINEENSSIKKEDNFFMEEKSLQTSFLDNSRLELAEKLEKVEIESAKFEAERDVIKELLSQEKEEMTKKIHELEDMITKCRLEHEATKNEMEYLIGVAQRKDEFKSEALDEYKEKIEKMEKELEKVADLQTKIKKMNVVLEQCQAEKKDLESLLEEAEKKCRSLENQLEKAAKDKDVEIVSLQKEIKELIQAKAVYEEFRERESEKHIKSTLKTLTATEEALAEEKENIKKLQKQNAILEKDLQVCKETIETLNIIEEKDRYLQEEILNLREDYHLVKNEVQQKQIELEKFSQNRDETVKRYENLVNTLQEDLDREKKEVMRLQELFQRLPTPTPSKDEVKKLKMQLEDAYDQLRALEEEKENQKLSVTHKTRKTRQRKNKEIVENTSEDEAPLAEHRRRSPRLQKLSPTHTNEGSIIELSSTESKRQTRLRTALPPPDIQSLPSEKKKNNRRKKLFVPDNETCVDLEPSEAPTLPGPSPLTALRSLRTRKK